MKEKKVKDGESLQGTSVHTISDSIPISKYTSASCTMKLSNFLESALTDLQCYFSFGSRNTGPMRVAGNFTEVFSFHGARYGCDFLCSFVISEAMRLTIRCFSCTSGDIYFGLGFTPAEVLTNHELLHTLHEMPLKPGVWMINKQSTKFPLESFAINGNLLARGHMTNGPRSIVHVEILKIMEISWPPSVVKGKKCLTDGKSFELNPFPNKGDSISRSIRKHGRFSCNVEIANCLNVPLRNGNELYSNDKNFWPLEIQSFHRETFLGSSDTNFKAMFSYEIVSTDLALVIALTVGPGTNSFAASFSQIPAQCDKYELQAKPWK